MAACAARRWLPAVGLAALAAAAPGVAPARVELHVHLDGSVDVDELFRICIAREIQLPGIGRPASPDDVRRYIGAHPGWQRFDVVNDIIGGEMSVIQRVATAFVGFQARSGVQYTEVRYDPVRLARSNLRNVSIAEEEAVLAVEAGLAAGAALYGVEVYQILCAMRGQPAAKCVQVAQLAAKMRSHGLGGVVAIDLAGDETDFPNAPYVDCFRYAKQQLGLNTTVHAGEFTGTKPEEVRSAILDMGVDRVGHGYAAAQDPALLALLRERGVHVEACPRSAQQHGPWAFQAVKAFRDQALNFGLNTDDPASSFANTTAAEDEALVKSQLGFTDEDIARAYRAARAAAFGPPPRPSPEAWVYA